jgi:hypothetical protein
MVWCDAMWYDMMWFDAMWCDVMLCNVMWCYVIMWVQVFAECLWCLGHARRICNGKSHVAYWSIYSIIMHSQLLSHRLFCFHYVLSLRHWYVLLWCGVVWCGVVWCVEEAGGGEGRPRVGRSATPAAAALRAGVQPLHNGAARPPLLQLPQLLIPCCPIVLCCDCSLLSWSGSGSSKSSPRRRGFCWTPPSCVSPQGQDAGAPWTCLIFTMDS